MWYNVLLNETLIGKILTKQKENPTNGYTEPPLHADDRLAFTFEKEIMKRIHIPNMGPDTSTIHTAIAIGVHECKQTGTADLTLITPVKNNLDTIAIGDFLGQDVAKRLMKGDRIVIGNYGVSLNHHSVSTIQKIRTPSIGLAFYVSKDDIKKLDALEFNTLIFVPWLNKEGVEWAQKWDAQTHGGTPVDSTISLPSEVEKSMKRLTTYVNLSTGLGHPSDKEHAKRRFTELRSAGVIWNPKELEKWAVRNGWKPSDAEKLSKLSARYTKTEGNQG